MNIHSALSRAAKAQGWSATRVAAEVGVTEAAARRWLAGKAVPGGDTLMRLMERLPGFRAALDEPVTEAAS